MAALIGPALREKHFLLYSKIFGIAVVFMMVGAMLGGLAPVANAEEYGIGDTIVR